MKAKLSAVLFLAATAMLAQVPDGGRSTHDLQDFANRAKNAGDLQSEANYLCQAAAVDAKKYQKKCDRVKNDASKALAQFQADFETGLTEMQHKDYSGALRDLGKITFGPDKAAAQAWMRQARIGISGGIAVDPLSVAAFKATRDAYLRGDFDGAESLARRVQSPLLQTATNQLLNNIKVYRDTMQQADAMARKGDLKGAEGQYQFAASIQQNGPGRPQDRLRETRAAEAQTAAAKPQPVAPVQTAPQANATPPSTKVNIAKSKKTLDTPHREETQGMAKHSPQNSDTTSQPAARQDIAGKKPGVEGVQEDPKAMEDSLTEGIADFNASHFSHADDAFGRYLQGNAKPYAGAAHFYLGASLLTQAILTSPKNQPRVDALRRRAREEFVLAKQLHYKPIVSAVSPKIFTQWTQVGEQ
ncbi:hypothetical protein [Edaphobacter aggregans]|uniref:hypothetical protein n=1 Tax=Edaphobacter aggregans TaxID=570835 RepID=UPI000552053C|nr:hypothetical protein [Edaphobacter aggregans]